MTPAARGVLVVATVVIVAGVGGMVFFDSPPRAEVPRGGREEAIAWEDCAAVPVPSITDTYDFALRRHRQEGCGDDPAVVVARSADEDEQPAWEIIGFREDSGSVCAGYRTLAWENWTCRGSPGGPQAWDADPIDETGRVAVYGQVGEGIAQVRVEPVGAEPYDVEPVAVDDGFVAGTVLPQDATAATVIWRTEDGAEHSRAIVGLSSDAEG